MSKKIIWLSIFFFFFSFVQAAVTTDFVYNFGFGNFSTRPCYLNESITYSHYLLSELSLIDDDYWRCIIHSDMNQVTNILENRSHPDRVNTVQGMAYEHDATTCNPNNCRSYYMTELDEFYMTNGSYIEFSCNNWHVGLTGTQGSGGISLLDKDLQMGLNLNILQWNNGQSCLASGSPFYCCNIFSGEPVSNNCSNTSVSQTVRLDYNYIVDHCSHFNKTQFNNLDSLGFWLTENNDVVAFIDDITISAMNGTNTLPSYNLTFTDDCYNKTKGQADIKYNISAYDREGDTIYVSVSSCDNFCREETLVETFSTPHDRDYGVFTRGNLYFVNDSDLMYSQSAARDVLCRATTCLLTHDLFFFGYEGKNRDSLVVENGVDYWGYDYGSMILNSHDLSIEFSFFDNSGVFNDEVYFDFIVYGSSPNILNITFNYTKDEELRVYKGLDLLFNSVVGKYPSEWLQLIFIFRPDNSTKNLVFALMNDTQELFSVYENISYEGVSGFFVDNVHDNNYVYVVDNIKVSVWNHVPEADWTQTLSGTYTTSDFSDFYFKFYITDEANLGQYFIVDEHALTLEYCHLITDDERLLLDNVKKYFGGSLKEYLISTGYYETGKSVLWWIFIGIFFSTLLTWYFTFGSVSPFGPLMLSSIGSFFIAWSVDYLTHMLTFLIVFALGMAAMTKKMVEGA